MNFTKTDNDYFEVMSEMVNQSKKRHIIIKFNLSNTDNLIKELKKEGLHTYKKKEYEKTLYVIRDDKKNEYFKEKIGKKTRYFEQQEFKSSIPELTYYLIEDIKKIDHKEKLLHKEDVVAHEFVFNNPETPHTFTIYEEQDMAELKLSYPPEITPEKIKYDILSFCNFIKLKEAESNVYFFYKFMATPRDYMDIPFLSFFNKIVSNNLVAYDIITTFIDMDDFIDVLYNHKMIITNNDYKSKVNHDLSEKLNGIEEIDGMTPEKVDICREKLKEIVDILI
jgi:hypothetical protein